MKWDYIGTAAIIGVLSAYWLADKVIDRVWPEPPAVEAAAQ